MVLKTLLRDSSCDTEQASGCPSNVRLHFRPLRTALARQKSGALGAFSTDFSSLLLASRRGLRAARVCRRPATRRDVVDPESIGGGVLFPPFSGDRTAPGTH